MQDIFREIAINRKDRIVILDRDLLERKVSADPDTKKILYSVLKGRHYKNLKQGGSGWSLKKDIFDAWVNRRDVKSVSVDIERSRRYDIDIPQELYDAFSDYQKKIFTSS